MPEFNLYLEEIGPIDDSGMASKYRLVMPDESGELPERYLKAKTGIAIRWPVNPHYTGRYGIVELLNRQYSIGRPII